MENRLDRMKELVGLLNQAAKAYYVDAEEIMSNYEYDQLYDELITLEKESGVVLSNSPTARVGYEVLSELPKCDHQYPMLSLDKTKDLSVLADWLGDQNAVLSWKLDGLTIVLTYENGKLLQAVTRGNGYTGEVITNNAKVFENIPHQIPFKGKMTLRGEAVIKYSDFEKINAEIEEIDAKYKNPRNLCSGSVRQLNNEITAKRHVYFFAFALVEAENLDFNNRIVCQMDWMKQQGFDVVEYVLVDRQSISDAVHGFSEKIVTNDFPSDGLVLMFDNISYGLSLGMTSKFPRNAIAFKWKDEIKETNLLEVEWSASRTGLINPIAIFEPVELEGTTVSRASLHNVSILKGLELGLGDTIQVYKANMIIPQIAENLTRSDTLCIPSHCPVCAGKTVIKEENGVQTLYCTNPACGAKHIKRFAHYVSRDAMNIEGLSEATLEKMIDRGFIHELADIYNLSQYEQDIISMDGFGKKSFDKMIQSIEKSKDTSLYKFIYSLGIPNVGLSNAKLICRAMENNLYKIMGAMQEDYMNIDGIGPVIAQSMADYFADYHQQEKVKVLVSYLRIEEEAKTQALIFEGKTFVITGSVVHYKNRNEIKNEIERLGGKVAGSVSSKTDYLINNDTTSNSSKNQKAKALNIPIISEEDYMALLQKDE